MASKKEKRHKRAEERYKEISELVSKNSVGVQIRWDVKNRSALFYEALVNTPLFEVTHITYTGCDHKCDVNNLSSCHKYCEIRWCCDHTSTHRREYRCAHYCSARTCCVGD